MQDQYSVRFRILEAIRTAITEIAPPVFPFAFSTVELGPLGMEDQRKQYTCGIVTGAEREKHTFPYVECNLSIALEFRVAVNKGDPRPAVMGEAVLTVMKRIVDANRSWGGLAVDTKRTGNEIDLTTYGEKSVVGVQFIEVLYRTSHLDPRDEQPDLT